MINPVPDIITEPKRNRKIITSYDYLTHLFSLKSLVKKPPQKQLNPKNDKITKRFSFKIRIHNKSLNI